MGQPNGLHIGRLATAVWPGQDGDPPAAIKFRVTWYGLRRLAECQMDVDQPFNLCDPFISTGDFRLAESNTLLLKSFYQGHSRHEEGNFLFKTSQRRTADMHIAPQGMCHRLCRSRKKLIQILKQD